MEWVQIRPGLPISYNETTRIDFLVVVLYGRRLLFCHSVAVCNYVPGRILSGKLLVRLGRRHRLDVSAFHEAFYTRPEVGLIIFNSRDLPRPLVARQPAASACDVGDRVYRSDFAERSVVELDAGVVVRLEVPGSVGGFSVLVGRYGVSMRRPECSAFDRHLRRSSRDSSRIVFAVGAGLEDKRVAGVEAGGAESAEMSRVVLC